MATKLAYSVADAADALGISRSKIYELILLGDIKAHKIGRRTIITIQEIESFLNSLTSVKN
jgi:excisionase family DNA binding protein